MSMSVPSLDTDVLVTDVMNAADLGIGTPFFKFVRYTMIIYYLIGFEFM